MKKIYSVYEIEKLTNPNEYTLKWVASYSNKIEAIEELETYITDQIIGYNSSYTIITEYKK